ncbi:MAG: ATPase P [Calditrichaeota bacterium]|nr:ATPase P [Calditrichota bacterium]
MIETDIPGFGKISLKYAVFDYNGTLAIDGELLPGVKDKLSGLSSQIAVHILTADTFGKAAAQLADLPVTLHILQGKNEAFQKLDYINSLGADRVVTFGNGNNDRLMLAAAALGIIVMENEGCSMRSLQAANIGVRSILDGIDLLLQPMRLKATLRF